MGTFYLFRRGLAPRWSIRARDRREQSSRAESPEAQSVSEGPRTWSEEPDPAASLLVYFSDGRATTVGGMMATDLATMPPVFF